MKLLPVFSILMLPIISFGAIFQVNSMEEASNYYSEADSNTLAIFDIHEVLLHPSDPAFQMPNIKKHSTIAKNIIASLPQEKRPLFYNLIQFNSGGACEVDSYTKTLFDQLDSQGVKKIALTASLAGSLVDIANIEDLCIVSLRFFGLNFSRSFCLEEPLFFEDVAPFRGNYPVLKQGVLFTNGARNPKGERLNALLQRINYSPKKVIFMDDKLTNLHSVEAALQQHNPEIEFIGLIYKGAELYKSEPVTAEYFTSRWQELAAIALISE